MPGNDLDSLLYDIATMRAARPMGRVSAVRPNGITVLGLAGRARVGDQVSIALPGLPSIAGEIISMSGDTLTILPRGSVAGVALGDRATLEPPLRLCPDDTWIGRIIDPFGNPVDGKPLARGTMPLPLYREAPPAVARRPLGKRLETGLVVFNTMLPLVEGQRIGIFAGSGVGKTTLLGQLAQGVDADVVVIALIGERGREIRHFVESVLGELGMQRSIIVAATSDQSPIIRRQCAFAAMTIAEFFRDQGKSVLFFADSITRLAEAHREVAVAAGEPPSLRGHPASMSSLITSLCERAGPGSYTQGDITAVLSVLVAGSDMDEPVADTLRGVLDGHIILDRDIAEAGRFPAVDVVRSVSRSLPEAANAQENAMIAKTKRLMSAFENSKTMIRAGLYSEGSDSLLDQAVRVQPELETLFTKPETRDTDGSFLGLKSVLRIADAHLHATRAAGNDPS